MFVSIIQFPKIKDGQDEAFKTWFKLPAESFAAAATKDTAGRYGIQPMIDCYGSFGDAMGNMWSKARRVVTVDILPIRFCIRHLWRRLMLWL